MQYVSLVYLLGFLPVLLIVYSVLPKRFRWFLLLLASYFFFFLLSHKLILYLILSTFLIHHIGLWLERYCLDDAGLSEEEKRTQAAANARKKRMVLSLGVVLHLGILFLMKYSNFFTGNVNHVLSRLSLPVSLPVVSLAAPIGISFFTLQAISYMVDVYQGKIKADNNLGRVALYMAFFPAIMEGPICRYSQTAEDLYAGEDLKSKNVTFGIQMILWGLFKKLIIADRLNIIVKVFFNEYANYGGFTVVLGAVCYTLQLYADFSGCIDVSIGTAEMFGVRLPENFRQPFFSRTPSEFWHRWHITLGTWFKDYIFYPLSVTKLSKKIGRSARNKLGRYYGQIVQTLIPLFAVWVSNGIWHGAGWCFLFYGMYYFALIVAGNFLEPSIAKFAAFLHLDRKDAVWRAMQTIKMAFIVVTGEMIFRSNGLRAAFSMLKTAFFDWSWKSPFIDGSLPKYGFVPMKDSIVVILGLLIMLIVDLLHENGISVREKVQKWNVVPRWAFYYAVILAVIIFGAYGAGYAPVDPMYAAF